MESAEQADWKARGRDAAQTLAALQNAPLALRESIRQAAIQIAPTLAKDRADRSDRHSRWEEQAVLMCAAAPWLRRAAAGDAKDNKANAANAWEQLERHCQQLRLEPTNSPSPNEGHDIALGWQWLLQGFDQAQRRKHGAFYTPPRLARFMVRCASQLAARHFDGRCHVVDPAAGTGVFLGHWMETNPTGALGDPSLLHGWELMPATAALANALLNQQCQAQNPLASGPRENGPNLFVQSGSALNERALVAGRPLVIIGNPPYSNYRSANDADAVESSWLTDLLASYKRDLSEKKHNLHDDFIRFFRWSQHQIETAGTGLLAFVTNNTFLAGITHRIMRRSLLETFDQAWVLNLRGEQFQADPADENVFGIRQGVAISFWLRNDARRPTVRYCELQGSRASKLQSLDAAPSLEDLSWSSLTPAAPEWLCIPAPNVAAASRAGTKSSQRKYADGLPLTEIAHRYVSGVQTKADRLFIDQDRELLTRRIRQLFSKGSESAPTWLRDRLAMADYDDRHLAPIQVAPLDRRWVYYDPQLLGRARWGVMRHLLFAGCGLVFMRQSTNPGVYDHFLATDCLVTDRVFRSRHGAPYVAPWRLDMDALDEPPRIDEAFMSRWGCSLIPWNLSPRAVQLLRNCPDAAPPPESIWHYIYAVTHATAYRVDNARELARDFPRIPIASSLDQFTALADLGSQLSALHTKPPNPAESIARTDRTVFPIHEGAETTPWRIGGVDVLARWKQQRKPWTDKRQQHWLGLANIAEQSLQLVAQIDDVYDADHR